jgi:hypothetical protein
MPFYCFVFNRCIRDPNRKRKYVVFAAHNFISGEGDGKPFSRILGAFEGKFSRSIQWFLSAIQIDKVQPLLSGET